MSQTEPAIAMTRRVNLTIDWKQLSSSLADVLTQGFITALGVSDGSSSAFSALINAFSAVKLEDKPEEKVWRLFILSFAWSIDQLRATGIHDNDSLIKLAREAVAEAKNTVDTGTVEVPLTFFSRPVTLPLYQKLRDSFVHRSTAFRVSGNESAEDLSSRFDTSFSRAMFEVWTRKPDEFQSLLALTNNPAAIASTNALQWEAYRQRLIFDFDVQPMFGQEEAKLSLSQAYIPLRCIWKEQVQVEGDEFTAATSRIAVLDDFLLDWINDATDTEVRLIGGGPGSGKSTSVKHLARKLSEAPSVRPLFIPLQHISLEGQLRDAVNSYFTGRTRGTFTGAPLSRESVEDGARLLLIFDGLDEIARPGEGADEVANLFINKLDQLIAALKGDSDIAPKVVVTGRLPSFQAAKRFAGALGKSAIEVVGYAPQPREYSDNALSSRDRRVDWWLRYGPLAGLSPDVPAALKDTRLLDLTNEPLLCYLLVLSGFAVDDWESAADNRNRIYQRLINEVWKRGWGDTKKDIDRQGPGRNLGKISFNDLMETFALAAWLGGDTRVATEDSFKSTLRITHAEEAWVEFNGDGGEDIANLAMNFYLKSPDGNHRGFEFTHKSFGDYLTARSIVALAKEVSSLVPRHTDAALQTWMKGTSGGVLSNEILSFIRDEMRLMALDDAGLGILTQLFPALQTLVKVVVEEGLPAHQTGGSWRLSSRNQKESEITLWAVLNSCARSIFGRNDKHDLINVGLRNNPYALKVIIARLAIGDQSESVFLKCLSHLDAGESDLFGLNLTGADFVHSNLERANLNGTHLMRAVMDYVNLESAKLERSNLDSCSFKGARMEETNITDARLRNCNILGDSLGTLLVSNRTLLDIPLKVDIPADKLSFSTRTRRDEEIQIPERAQRASGLYESYALSHPDRKARWRSDENGEVSEIDDEEK